jgi:hypothetical protein
MNAPARQALALAIALTAAASVPSAATGDGLPPSEGIDAAPVWAPGGSVEYLTKRARRGANPRRATLVVARERGSERVVVRLRLPGTFSVPAVAYDGSAGGLSADGRTLVLIRPRRGFPRSRTTLAVLDAKRLHPRRLLRLRGDFSFDAISPRGALIYLIQYISRRNPNHYLVRAYDLRARRLLAEPVVDPREESELMDGLPVTRAASPDGRWAYTLYDGAEHPFIHALDTERRRALCIDLHSLAGRRGGLWGLRLDVGPDGSPLSVEAGSRVLANVDTRTFRVTEPSARPSAARRQSAAAGEDGADVPWLYAAVAAGAAVLLLAAVARLGAGRRRPSPGRKSGPEDSEPERSHGRARADFPRRRRHQAGAAAASARRAMRPVAPSSTPAESNAAVAPPTSRPVRPPPRRKETDADSSAPRSAGARS